MYQNPVWCSSNMKDWIRFLGCPAVHHFNINILLTISVPVCVHFYTNRRGGWMVAEMKRELQPWASLTAVAASWSLVFCTWNNRRPLFFFFNRIRSCRETENLDAIARSIFTSKITTSRHLVACVWALLIKVIDVNLCFLTPKLSPHISVTLRLKGFIHPSQ